MIAVLAAAVAAGGCGGRPYAADPLLHAGHGVRGDATRAMKRDPGPPAEPAIPPPPPARSDLIAHLDGIAPAVTPISR